MNKAIFLDRDGVLNQTVFRDGKPRAPYALSEFALFQGVVEGVQLLKEKGYVLIVVTNQPDVARGWVSREAVVDVNNKLRELIPVDDIKICFHTEKDHCACRKPQPGMLLEASQEKNIDLKNSYMIGDRYSDVEAGIRAGCKTILIGPGDEKKEFTPDYQFDSLFEAAQKIAALS